MSKLKDKKEKYLYLDKVFVRLMIFKDISNNKSTYEKRSFLNKLYIIQIYPCEQEAHYTREEETNLI